MVQLILICLLALGSGVSHPALGVVNKPIETSWITLDFEPNHMRISPKGQYVAYVGQNNSNLKVLEISTKKIFEISKGFIGGSYFWSPDGHRIFYRELVKDNNSKVVSRIKAYDCFIKNSVQIEELKSRSGYLTFDPRDLRMQLLSPAGIKSKRIYFPDERLAKWQVAQRTEEGKWLVSQNAVLWVKQNGLAMDRMADDGSGLLSYDISPDGSAIVWATKSKKIYTSENGGKIRFVDRGIDPRWHPEKRQIVYAGGRLVGNKIINYDIKLYDWQGNKRFLTSTQFVNERWPHIHPKTKKILFSREKSNEIFQMALK